MARDSRGVPGLVEVCSLDDLTLASARTMADAISGQLRNPPAELWLNLEAVKAVDVVGLSVIAQAVSRAKALNTSCVIFPSAIVYRALLRGGLLPRIATDRRRPVQRGEADTVVEVERAPFGSQSLPGSPTLRLAPPTWDELRLLEKWANDEVLTRMVGSELLATCRHLGPHDGEFLAEAFGSATGLTFLIHPIEDGAQPVGFVRLYNVNLGQGFAFLETVIADLRGRRRAWGIEASRVVSRYAVDALSLHRLETKVYADNVASVNALRHHGFVLEGRLRQAHVRETHRTDVLVFGILEPEIRARLAAERVPDMRLWPE